MNYAFRDNGEIQPNEGPLFNLQPTLKRLLSRYNAGLVMTHTSRSVSILNLKEALRLLGFFQASPYLFSLHVQRQLVEECRTFQS